MAFNLADVLAVAGIQVNGLHCEAMTLDSRKAKSGTVFLAVKGFAVDGRKFINSALELGATVAIAEADDEQQHGFIEATDTGNQIIYCYQLKSYLSQFAHLAAKRPSESLTVVGITGTNGKTSVSQLTASLLAELDQLCGVVGTAGEGVWPNLTETANTTPDPIGLQFELARQAQLGAGWCAMEVSSHGLEQQRVSGVHFKVAVFTNLSRDHLDYHHTMSAYAEAKYLLFQQQGLETAVINVDDATGLTFYNKLSQSDISRIACSTAKNFSCDGLYVCARNLSPTAHGLSFDLESSWGHSPLNINLLGQFNVANLLAAFAALLSQGIELQQLVTAAEKLQPVIGRMESFGDSDSVTAVVDYAHTPDALEQALKALRPHCGGELWCVFGCGGDRDKGKRPMMGEIAETLADKVIVTDDNPRSEDSELIAKDILDGCNSPDSITVILDRRSAIKHSLTNAGNDDVVLIAGKGHENYQIIKNKTLPYDERQFVADTLGEVLQ